MQDRVSTFLTNNPGSAIPAHYIIYSPIEYTGFSPLPFNYLTLRQNNMAKKISEQMVRETIIHPVGGIDRFRLVVCPGFKIIQYLDDEDQFLDLIIENDNLANATITLLEQSGVVEISRDAR